MDSNHRSRRRQIYSLIHLAALEPVRLLWCSAQAVEPVIGLEPTTCWLQISCSANWATPACGALRWNRTIDRRIFSPLLYQLSYQGVSRFADIEIDTYFITSQRGKVFEKRVKKWRPKRGSNSWPPAWQAGALTKLSYWAVHKKYKIWWAFTDSNRGPIGYEPTALTTELKAHTLLGRSFPSHNACIW